MDRESKFYGYITSRKEPVLILSRQGIENLLKVKIRKVGLARKSSIKLTLCQRTNLTGKDLVIRMSSFWNSKMRQPQRLWKGVVESLRNQNRELAIPFFNFKPRSIKYSFLKFQPRQILRWRTTSL